MARVTFVRSPVAHAMITGIDTSAALAAPGVVAALTAADLTDLGPPPPDDGSGGEPNEAAPLPLGGPWAEPLLAVDRVRYVGEPVAMVITDDRYQGEDAAELVSVDYEPLPAVVGYDAGAQPASTLLFPAAGTNVAIGGGAPADDSAFDGCEVVVERTIENQRLAPVPMEGRAAAATWAGRQADRLGEHPERADLPVHPVRRARARPRRHPGRRPRRRRRVRRQGRPRPGRDPGRLGRQAHRPRAALDRDPQREPARDDPRAGPSGRPSRSAAAGTGASRPTGWTSSRTPAPTRGWAASCRSSPG